VRPPKGDLLGGTRLLLDFGTDLREARRRAGLSQAAVAKRLGVNQSYVSLVERGMRNLPLEIPTVAFRPVTNVESPPGKAGFRVPKLLLAGRLPSPVLSIAVTPGCGSAGHDVP
jgi:hypothetical protein